MGLLLANLWLELLATTLILIWVYLSKEFNYWKKRKVPYVSPYSFYGNILPILTLKKSVNQYFEVLHRESVRKNSKFIGFWIAEKPCLYISDPELSKKILVQNYAYFSERLVGHKSNADTFGKSSLFLLKQNKWKNMRTRLSHVFSSGKLKRMASVFCDNSKNMLTFIKHHNETTGKQPLNSRDLTSRYSADNLVQVLLGLDGQCLKDLPGKKSIEEIDRNVPKYNDIGNSILSVSPYRALEFSSYFLIPEIANYFRFKFFSGNANQFFRDIFWSAVNIRRNNTMKMKTDTHEKTAPQDLLDLLIHFNDSKFEIDGMKYEGDVLPAQFAVLFTAGFETSSSSLSLFLSTMTQYPNVQDRIREEIKNIILKYGEINYDNLSELSYLDMAYKETLRLYPTLPFLDRLCTKSYEVEDSSLVIEKGTKIFLSLTGIQTDPRYWKDPYKFDPERFSPENKSRIIPFSYIPFGEGPKICIGERYGFVQTKLGIATILSKYRVRTDGSLKTRDELLPGESHESLYIPMENRGVVLAPKIPLTMHFDYMPNEN